MTTLRERTGRVRRAYSAHERRPLAGYVASMTAFAAATAGLAGAVRATGRPLPERVPALDVALLSVATHKLSRILTKDAVTSPLRAPFTRYVGPAGHGELHEEVRSDGNPVRHAAGELLTCPFCVAMWVATALAGGLVLAPRLTRLATVTLSAVAASDFLQLAYAAAQRAADGEPR